MDPSSSKTASRGREAAYQIHRTLSPRIAVLSSDDVNQALEPNNFSDLADCLRPFEQSLSGITVRTSQLEQKNCPTFPIRFDSLASFSSTRRGSLVEEENTPARGADISRNERPEEVIDRVNGHILARSKQWEARAGELELHSIEDVSRISKAEVEEVTPWFAFAKEAILQSRTLSRHETFGHPAAIILAVSTSSPDPLNDFASLYAATQATNCPVFSTRPYVDPNVLRYYVLIHDCSQNADLEESKSILETVKRMYGLNCCILPINSRKDGSDIATDTSTVWTETLGRDLIQSGKPGNDSTDEGKTDIIYGKLLDHDDIKRLKDFVRELVAQSLIPWMERCVSHWNDSVAASRKGLTGRLFGAGKKFFGSSGLSRSNSTGENRPRWNPQGGYYPHTTVEAQTRRLADFAFLTHDYKLAAAMYDIGRRDYADDKAVQYAAGANEMFGLSHLMMMLESHSTPIDVDSFLAAACNLYRLEPKAASSGGSLLRPLRATLLYCEAYKALDFWRSAPSALIRAAEDQNEELEAVGAMLLEQAALADLRLLPRASLRKFGLHLAMAGDRYRQCGAKLLSLRCLSGARQVYCTPKSQVKVFLDEEAEDIDADPTPADSFGWSIIQSHIENELGKQAFNDGRSDQALEHFLHTLKPLSAAMLGDEMAPQFQQTLHQEFLDNLTSAYQSLEAGDVEAPIKLPACSIFDAQQSQFRQESSLGDISPEDDAAWTALEAKAGTNQDTRSSRHLPAVVTQAETFFLDLCAVNPLDVPLRISDVQLIIVEADAGSHTAADGIETASIDDFTIPPRGFLPFSVQVKAAKTGRYRAAQVNYKLADVVSVTQELRKLGRRLNDTREQRTSVEGVYAADHSLLVVVEESRPLLQVELVDAPEQIFLGEEVDVTLKLTNAGKVNLKGLWTLPERPEVAALLPGPDSNAEDLGWFEMSNDVREKPAAAVLPQEGELSAGGSMTLSLRIRGASLGPLAMRLLFFFKTAGGQQTNVRCGHRMTVNPIVEVAAEVNPATEGFAYALRLAVVGQLEHEHVKMSNVVLVSPRWQHGADVANDGSQKSGEALAPIPFQQEISTLIPLGENMSVQQLDASREALVEYTKLHVAELLRGRDIDQRSKPPSVQLRVSSSGDNGSTHLSPFLHPARSQWRRQVLAEQFPAITQAERERVFTLYRPEDLDVVVNWEAPDGSRKGQIFIFGLSIGPGIDYISPIVKVSGAGQSRSMYEETAKARAALLENLTQSPLAVEENPLVFEIDVQQDTEGDSRSSRSIPTLFKIRNMSTTRSARCTIELSGTVEVEVNRPLQSEGRINPQPGAALAKAAWSGRLTLDSGRLQPRQSTKLQATVRLPVLDAEDERKQCELGDWSMKTDVMTGGPEEKAEVLQKFRSGRLRGGHIIHL